MQEKGPRYLTKISVHYCKQKCTVGCTYAHFSNVVELKQYLKRMYGFQFEVRGSDKRGMFFSKQLQNNVKRNMLMRKLCLQSLFCHVFLRYSITPNKVHMANPLHLSRMTELVYVKKKTQNLLFSLAFWECCSLSSVTLKNYALIMSSRVNLLTVTPLIWEQVVLTQIWTSSTLRNVSSASIISDTVQRTVNS